MRLDHIVQGYASLHSIAVLVGPGRHEIDITQSAVR